MDRGSRRPNPKRAKRFGKSLADWTSDRYHTCITGALRL